MSERTLPQRHANCLQASFYSGVRKLRASDGDGGTKNPGLAPGMSRGRFNSRDFLQLW